MYRHGICEIPVALVVDGQRADCHINGRRPPLPMAVGLQIRPQRRQACLVDTVYSGLRRDRCRRACFVFETELHRHHDPRRHRAATPLSRVELPLFDGSNGGGIKLAVAGTSFN
ncbi:MAG: hypothetical protein BWZ07_03069 [Alphaproteobacteria bacterium ADurb.BinA280]|nr:MAG: hypothetical protein BWZ07_03069 [Alphaproteobacteria bacterium ADurb.BinA280]